MKQLTQIMPTLKTSLVAALCILAIAIATSGQAEAQNGAPASANQVFVGGTFFLTIRSSWGGLSASQRADEVQTRINNALSSGPVHPSDITVGKLDGDWVVFFRGQRLYTADEITAKEESASAEVLAQTWASQLRVLLPPLTAPTNN